MRRYFYGAFGFLLGLTLGFSTTLADQITMTFGESTPPYAFAETADGMEVDIIREALAYRDHTLEPVFVPAARVEHQFKQGAVDAASKDPGGELEAHGGHYGDISMEYYDVLVTLKDRNIDITAPSDLEGLQVIAFQNAWKFFPEWLSGPKEAGFYDQTPDQAFQVEALISGRADAAVADRNIFTYHSKRISEKRGEPLPELSFTEFQPPLLVRPVFRDVQIRDDFNVGLKHLRESGRYQEIVDQYLE